ncbi:hypothetical protein AVEN_70881-1 [Araneus ventricosus]|uniref:Uncharacterized protein n=1 Tax=Araneus ventricosus TaxID=182803 RepID=A0A4Y2L816_ARAVE|nr:hypothetical protein AVEN_70881-1 [Araneus ventricosus]
MKIPLGAYSYPPFPYTRKKQTQISSVPELSTEDTRNGKSCLTETAGNSRFVSVSFGMGKVKTPRVAVGRRSVSRRRGFRVSPGDNGDSRSERDSSQKRLEWLRTERPFKPND